MKLILTTLLAFSPASSAFAISYVSIATCVDKDNTAAKPSRLLIDQNIESDTPLKGLFVTDGPNVMFPNSPDSMVVADDVTVVLKSNKNKDGLMAGSSIEVTFSKKSYLRQFGFTNFTLQPKQMTQFSPEEGSLSQMMNKSFDCRMDYPDGPQ